MSYPSSRRRFHVRRRHPVVVADIGCGCRRKPKLFSLLNYFTTKNKSSSSSSYSTNATTITNSTFSPCCNNDDSTTASSTSASPNKLIKKSKSKSKSKMKKKKGVVELELESSVAVEKDSSDPYVDFKESMVQMIVEKGIMYEWEELRELLNLFLSLNSPCHHHLILRAFTEVWEDLYSNSHRHHTTY